MVMTPLAHASVSIEVAVSVEAGALTSAEAGTLMARVQWLGALKEAPLMADEDGVWRASFSGPQPRAIGVELWRTDSQPHRRLSQSLEITPRGDSVISYAISKGGDDAAWRLSRPIGVAQMRTSQERTAMAAALWVLVATVLVLVLGRKALARRDLPLANREWSASAEMAGWLAISMAWTWPSAWPGPNVVGRHFDALGTVWVIDAASRLGLDLHDPFSAWPEGATYSAIDSWVLLLLSYMGSALEPSRMHGILAVIGVASAGFAASRFALMLGAKTPTHWLAGVLFAGSGLVATAILEGHVYQVVNPWMPWMAMFLVLAASEKGKWEHGVLAGLCFSAALFSSGYLGVGAGVVALGLGVHGLMIAPDRRPLAVSAAVAVVAFGLFLMLFSSAGTPGATHATLDTLRMGSLSLSSMGPATLEVDRTHHSWALALSAMMIALAWLGMHSGVRHVRALFFIAIAAIVISMGPEWAMGIAPDEPRIQSPLSFFWALPEVRFLRFPGRVMWAALLPLSALAALGLSALMMRLGNRMAALIGALVVAETIVCVGLPFRQVTHSWDEPSAYQVADGAVFDLVGEGVSASRESDAWINAMLCQYQSRHGRPIADDCVAVGPDVNPRVPMAAWVASRLFEGSADDAIQRLSSQGYTAIAVHYDWLDLSNGVRIKSALNEFNGVQETERGDGVVVYPFSAGMQAATVESGPPKRLQGPAFEGSIQWRMRADLIVPRDRETARYFISLDGAEAKELKDKATVPGAQYDDGIFSLAIIQEASQAVDFRLTEVNEGTTRMLWSGTVMPIDTKEDWISFRMDEAGAVDTMLRSMDMHSPEVRSRGGKILGLGWLSALLMMALWWVRIRKDHGVARLKVG